MKKAFCHRRVSAGEHRRAGSVHLRIWRPYHSHRSGSWNGFDPGRLRQQRTAIEALAQRSGQRPSAQSRRPQQAKVDPQAPAARARRPTDAAPPAPANAVARAFDHHSQRCAGGYRGPTPASGQRACAASSAGRCARRQAGAAAGRCRRSVAARRRGPAPPRQSSGQFAARRLADRREGRQGPDRAMRRQSLRLFRGREIEPERRTGSDQHEARQGCQMERPHSRPEHRQHL